MEDGMREKEVNVICEAALQEVARKYGTGIGDGETPLAYHHLGHTLDVDHMFLALAARSLQNQNIKVQDIDLGRMAASCHDMEHGLGRGASEDFCSAWLRQAMYEADCFSAEEIDAGDLMVQATKVWFDDGYAIQRPGKLYLCKLIADADLSNLGRDKVTYWYWSMALLKEMKETEQPT